MPAAKRRHDGRLTRPLSWWHMNGKLSASKIRQRALALANEGREVVRGSTAVPGMELGRGAELWRRVLPCRPHSHGVILAASVGVRPGGATPAPDAARWRKWRSGRSQRPHTQTRLQSRKHGASDPFDRLLHAAVVLGRFANCPWVAPVQCCAVRKQTRSPYRDGVCIYHAIRRCSCRCSCRCACQAIGYRRSFTADSTRRKPHSSTSQPWGAMIDLHSVEKGMVQPDEDEDEDEDRSKDLVSLDRPGWPTSC